MFKKLFDEYGLTEAENILIDGSKTGRGEIINQSQIASSLYNIKKTEIFINKLIESNRCLSKSNRRYSLALNILTGALVIVGLIQIFCGQ